MKKPAIAVLMLSFLFILSACGSDNGKSSELYLEPATVKAAVKGWEIYTNPAFRYEMRFPNNWDYQNSGEDGLWVLLFPRIRRYELGGGTYFGTMKILSYINWQNNYTLDSFYKNQKEDLLAAEYAKEKVLIGGYEGWWIKQVRNRVDNPERKTDIVALELGDRIIEIEIYDDFDSVKKVINSLKFYQSVGKEIK